MELNVIFSRRQASIQVLVIQGDYGYKGQCVQLSQKKYTSEIYHARVTEGDIGILCMFCVFALVSLLFEGSYKRAHRSI
jgi:hypothetical protein